MIKNTLTRGISAGALATLATACGHLPIAQPAFNAMKVERSSMPTDWTIGEMTGDTSAMLADYSVFNDPQLISYVQEALKNNRTIRGSLETLRQSELALQSTRSRLFPQLTASASARSSTLTEDFNLNGPAYGFNVNGTYAVDIMGDLNASIQASSAGLRSTAATVEQTRRQIAQQTARAYFAVIEQQMQLDLEKRSYERSQQSYRITETRFQAGSIDKGEYVNAQAGLKQAEDQILAAENSARSAVRALEVILGRFPQNKLAITGALPEPPPAPPLGLPELTIRSRPDVVAAELDMIRTFSAQRRAQMLPWPQLDATLGLTLNNTKPNLTGADLFDFDQLAFTIGATLFQTIFDGGAIDAQVKTADSQVRAAMISYGGRIINDYAEIVNAIDQFNNLESRQRASQANSEARAEVLRLAELKYQEGSVSLFELLSQRDQADAAESSLITLRRSRLEQWLTLHTALGGNPTQALPLPTLKNVADGGKHG